MFVTTKQMLLDAQAGHYAVGAFNVENLEFLKQQKSAAPLLFFRPPLAPLSMQTLITLQQWFVVLLKRQPFL